MKMLMSKCILFEKETGKNMLMCFTVLLSVFKTLQFQPDYDVKICIEVMFMFSLYQTFLL